MELSLAGLVGALVGTILGVINYALIVGFVESRLRALDKSQPGAEREEFERKISVMRRTILGLDIFVFAGVGYVVGKTLGG
jgi:hypothetical protein